MRPGGRIGLVEAGSWFFQHDPRWAWQAQVFENFGVAVPAYEPERERARLVRALRRAHFAEVLALEEPCPLVFSDEEEWWAWLWSHGTRQLLETVPADELPALKRTLLRGLAACRDADGRLHCQLRAHLLLAAATPAQTLA